MPFYRKLLLLLIPLSIISVYTFAQITLSGTVYEEGTKTVLPGVNIYIPQLNKGTISGEDGSYTLSCKSGRVTVIYSFVGYQSDTLEMDLYGSIEKDIYLKIKSTTIGEITITGSKNGDGIQSTETGYANIVMEDIENLPYLLGEIDPLRFIQLLPGVQNAGDGSTGFYVRGGAIDQNMMLLDHAVVYNPSHLFGFFSIFNGGAIESIDMYKSGIPSYYGGRLSSITQVKTRSGDMQNFKAEGSLGVIAMNGSIEGPIKKGKSSFMISARRTYVDLYSKPLKHFSILKRDINSYFYDLNISLDFQVSDKDRLKIRSYSGKDDFQFSTGSGFENNISWQNKTASLTWQHTFDQRTFSDLIIHASGYEMDFSASINKYFFTIASSIADVGATYQVNRSFNRHELSFGISYTSHTVKPNNIDAFTGDVSLDLGNKVKLQGDEAAVFLNNKFELSERIAINAGMRLSGYSQIGPFTRFLTDDNLQIIDTTIYKKRSRIIKYANYEPRISLRIKTNEDAAVKISYDRTFQYMHMAPLSSVSLPMDVWVPSSSTIKPQSAHQFSAGYFQESTKSNMESSLVLYYKHMQNQIEYREGVIIGYSKGFNFDDNFVFGKGTSYGAEFLLKKTKGKINGMISYTLSKTTRRFEAINNAKAFPAKYDRLHDLAVMANHDLNKKWSFSTVFVYGTGNALNLPIARYIIQGNVINEYGDRNSFRMPSYHRMDISCTYKARKTARFESFWLFSIYNVYNRANPFYIYFQTEGDLEKFQLETSIKQVALFPVIPAVTYRVKFM